ncbi:MAG: fumarylacetoacetate hydrolase family protein [Kiloniellales bacterium]|nr:fumarylacetoacetate hydrolase family protein [Kiloniellales bacterium]
MLKREQIEKAADLILEHWRTGGQIAGLPEELRPGSRAEGYAIQASLEERSGQALFGWKIAATSEGGQRHIGVDGPLAGRLLADRVIAAGETPTLSGNHMTVAEPEFAFRMGRTLPARSEPYAVDDLLDAVGSLHLAIELPSSRFLDFAKVGAAQLIADNACAHQFLLGPAVEADWRDIDLSQHPVTGRVQGKLTEEGSGAAVLGDPRVALTWLANELSGLGIDLAAGQVVTTGTCTVPLSIAPGDRVEADFGRLGQIGLSLGS